jgi:hypothetical protein
MLIDVIADDHIDRFTAERERHGISDEKLSTRRSGVRLRGPDRLLINVDPDRSPEALSEKVRHNSAGTANIQAIQRVETPVKIMKNAQDLPEFLRPPLPISQNAVSTGEMKLIASLGRHGFSVRKRKS